MLNINSVPKSTGQEEKRNGAIRRQPLREHELLGLPKSTGKKDALNGTVTGRPRMQPVRIKDLFAASDSSTKSRRTTSDRRMTTMPNATSHYRTKLYESSKDQASPGNPSMIAYNGKKTSESAYCQGLSKSDGKIKLAGLGRERMEPEDMKDFLKSWEKVQTVSHSAHTSKPAVARSQNVRRKLYSMSHSSPIATAGSRTHRRPEAGTDKPTSQKSCIDDAKTVKLDSRKSTVAELPKVSRRSRIPPPNTIRDKYINIPHNETIKEETSMLSTSLESEARTMDCAKIPNDKKTDANEADELRKGQELPSNGNDAFPGRENVEEHRAKFVETTKSTETNESNSPLHQKNTPKDPKKCDKNPTEKFEISRPTVIMKISARGTRTGGGSESDARDSSLPDSRSPLKESHEEAALRREKLNEPNTSLEDLMSNLPRCDRGESICYENLPRDSFLETTTSAKNALVNVDRQTLLWMHGNLKLTVQSTEEHLFSMKLLLKTLEDVMRDQAESGTPEAKRKIESDAVSPPDAPIEAEKSHETLPEVAKENEYSDIAFESPDVSCPGEVNVETSMKDPEDSVLRNDDRDKENCEENVDKPLRRSPRLTKKWSCSPKCKDDSFSLTEKELNIVHAKKTKRHDTLLNRKSVNRIDPRCRRSVREYMALKSSSNFLATPDVNGFLTPGAGKDTPSHSRMTRRSLSRKLLAELDDLYGESPM